MRGSHLPSGLRFAYKYIPSPVVYIGVAIGVGSRHEKRGEHGLAHFIEHMLFKGTHRRSSKEVIFELERVGGELNAFTSKEETVLYALCPKEYTERALDLIADVILNSVFSTEEIRKEQTVVIDEIRGYEDDPTELIWDDFEALVFRGSDLSHTILGTEKSVSSFTQKKLLRFYSEHYRLDNMVLFIQGDINEQDIKQCAIRIFKTQLRVPSVSDYSIEAREVVQGASALAVVPKHVNRKKGTHQFYTVLGTTAYSMYDERRLGLSLLVNILGGSGMSSRLNMSLREDAGLVYHIECNYTPYTSVGILGISWSCSPAYQTQVMALVTKELYRISRETLSDEELATAKEQFKGQLTVSSDSYESYFLAFGKALLYKEEIDELEDTKRRIDQLDLQTLKSIAQEVFDPSRMFAITYK